MNGANHIKALLEAIDSIDQVKKANSHGGKSKQNTIDENDSIDPLVNDAMRKSKTKSNITKDNALTHMRKAGWTPQQVDAMATSNLGEDSDLELEEELRQAFEDFVAKKEKEDRGLMPKERAKKEKEKVDLLDEQIRDYKTEPEIAAYKYGYLDGRAYRPAKNKENMKRKFGEHTWPAYADGYSQGREDGGFEKIGLDRKAEAAPKKANESIMADTVFGLRMVNIPSLAESVLRGREKNVKLSAQIDSFLLHIMPVTETHRAANRNEVAYKIMKHLAINGKSLISEGHEAPLWRTQARSEGTRPGLSGPFLMANGKVIYYNPVVEMYCDPVADTYIEEGEIEHILKYGIKSLVEESDTKAPSAFVLSLELFPLLTPKRRDEAFSFMDRIRQLYGPELAISTFRAARKIKKLHDDNPLNDNGEYEHEIVEDMPIPPTMANATPQSTKVIGPTTSAGVQSTPPQPAATGTQPAATGTQPAATGTQPAAQPNANAPKTAIDQLTDLTANLAKNPAAATMMLNKLKAIR